MQKTDRQSEWYQNEFRIFEQGMNGGKTAPVHAIRREALRRFTESGFPTTRNEEWRFTNIAAIARTEFHPVVRCEKESLQRADIRPFILDGAYLLVFVNGIYSRALSSSDPLPPGIEAGSLLEVLKHNPENVQPHLARLVRGEENAFTALNTAFLHDGGFVSLKKGAVLDRPVQLLFVAVQKDRPFTAQPRNIIVAEDDTRAAVVETYVSLTGDVYLTNTVTELIAGRNAVVEHNKVQQENNSAYHIGTTHIELSDGSRCTSNAITLGGSIARNNITALLNAEGIVCTLNGLSVGGGNQLLDSHTVIDHANPRCESHELYKAILAGEARGVFNGKIFVRKDAQKTDAKQTNKTLLLSDDATIDTKPQLEIFADDVKCTHGATVGQLDDEQLFYLRSRGIDLPAARDILTRAFARDVVDRISIDPLRRQVDRMIGERLDLVRRESAAR